MKVLLILPILMSFSFNSNPSKLEPSLITHSKTEKIFELKGDLQKIKYGCCKVCTTGCACGDSCISCNKNCIKGVGCACDG